MNRNHTMHNNNNQGELTCNTPYGNKTLEELLALDATIAKNPFRAGDTVMDKISHITGDVQSITNEGVFVEFEEGHHRFYPKEICGDFLVKVQDYIARINLKYTEECYGDDKCGEAVVDCQGDDKYKLEVEWHDTVNKPKHYMLFPEHNIEVRDLMKLLAAQLDGHEDYSAMLISDYIQAMQYLLRWHNKNGVEDIKKAKWYLDKIIEELEENL